MGLWLPRTRGVLKRIPRKFLAPREVGRVATVGNTAASGVIAPANITSDVRVVLVAQTTPGLTLTLPSPSDATAVVGVDVINTGTVPFTMYNSVVYAGTCLRCIWSGSAWSGESTPSFSISGRNLLVDGNFAVNQRGYASGASLASNAYGHDRWKNTANSASSYYFTQATPPTSPSAPSSPDTVITIPSGCVLTQVVESSSIGGGSYTLSWTGTATASIGYYTSSSATTLVVTGASSPVTVTLPAGAFAYVSFNPGTLCLAQLELGTQATPYDRRPVQQELALCQRYYQLYQGYGSIGFAYSSSLIFFMGAVPVLMRVTPTVTLLKTTYNYPSGTPSGYDLATTGNYVGGSGITFAGGGLNGTSLEIALTGFSGLNPGAPYYYNNPTSPLLSLAADF